MHIFFAAFDVFPTAKGSTTRIGHTIHALRKFSETLNLACLGYGDMPRFQQEDRITVRRCLAMHPNFLKRTELFRDFLFDVLDGIKDNPDVIHFRDIWSGVPLLLHPHARRATKIFEVNGFASIELPVHYPRLYKNPVLLDHIRMMEDVCLSQADRIITVSRTNANYIKHRGITADKISIIPNIAEVPSQGSANSPFEGGEAYRKKFFELHIAEGCQFSSRKGLGGVGKEGCISTILHNPPPSPPRMGVHSVALPERESQMMGQFILYAGTLTPWQGVPTLLKAFELIADRKPLHLVLACSTKKFLKPVRMLIKKLKLRDRVDIKIGLSKEGLYRYYQHAIYTVVPLTRCDRNEFQGCCPLKILESMVAGTPVIASNIAVCRELIEHGENGWLVSPDSPRSLAYAMNTLLDNPELTTILGQRAQKKITMHYNRRIFADTLRRVYRINMQHCQIKL